MIFRTVTIVMSSSCIAPPWKRSTSFATKFTKAAEFFGNPARSVPGTEESLAKVSDQVNDCAGLRDREGAKVAEYLKRFVASDE